MIKKTEYVLGSEYNLNTIMLYEYNRIRHRLQRRIIESEKHTK